MTNTEKDDLVERLRGECRDYTGEMIDPRSTTREEVYCSLLYEAAARITELEGKLREIYEVYAGSEGLPCETASEAYLVRLIKEMANIATLKTKEPK